MILVRNSPSEQVVVGNSIRIFNLYYIDLLYIHSKGKTQVYKYMLDQGLAWDRSLTETEIRIGAFILIGRPVTRSWFLWSRGIDLKVSVAHSLFVRSLIKTQASRWS